MRGEGEWVSEYNQWKLKLDENHFITFAGLVFKLIRCSDMHMYITMYRIASAVDVEFCTAG